MQNFQDLPQNPDELFAWMVRLYQEKEAMLDAYYKTGNDLEFLRFSLSKDFQANFPTQCIAMGTAQKQKLLQDLFVPIH